MSPSRWIRPLAVGALLAAGAFVSQSALARGGGGHHGGFSHSGGGIAHSSGGFSHTGGGFSHSGGSYYRGSSGFRGGYGGGGYSRGYVGYGGGRHYYGGGGFSPFWGVLGLGLFVATLPYYSTYYWNGSPYYYSDGYYYRYDDSVRQYERVTLPAAATTQAAPTSTELYAYPKSGQSDAQMAQDKAECREWAGRQEGSSAAPAGAQPAAQAPISLADSLRAQTACLEGRGYTVR